MPVSPESGGPCTTDRPCQHGSDDGHAVVAATGAAALAGARMRGSYRAGLQAGVVFGAGFVHWLIGQSLYAIGALCPYCMVVWAVTMPIF